MGGGVVGRAHVHMIYSAGAGSAAARTGASPAIRTKPANPPTLDKRGVSKLLSNNYRGTAI